MAQADGGKPDDNGTARRPGGRGLPIMKSEPGSLTLVRVTGSAYKPHARFMNLNQNGLLAQMAPDTPVKWNLHPPIVLATEILRQVSSDNEVIRSKPTGPPERVCFGNSMGCLGQKK